MSAGWPVALRGVTESVVTTLGPNDRWNVAALGLHPPAEDDRPAAAPVRARTWGRTRTWRNFRERGGGYVQFTRDAVEFTEAALAVREEAEPVLDGADAWVEVTVERAGSGTEGDTDWVDWHLHPEAVTTRTERVPTTERGYAAVVELTVAASRLGVEAYDQAALRDRLRYFASVVERCGGDRERAALARARELVDAQF